MSTRSFTNVATSAFERRGSAQRQPSWPHPRLFPIPFRRAGAPDSFSSSDPSPNSSAGPGNSLERIWNPGAQFHLAGIGWMRIEGFERIKGSAVFRVGWIEARLPRRADLVHAFRKIFLAG